MTTYLNDKLLWALKPDAQALLADLVAIGLDKDLALAIMEQTMTDEALYDLPEQD